MMLKNQIQGNTMKPTGTFHGSGIRWHGPGNQLVVLSEEQQLPEAETVDGKDLEGYNGAYYPYGSLFG